LYAGTAAMDVVSVPCPVRLRYPNLAMGDEPWHRTAFGDSVRRASRRWMRRFSMHERGPRSWNPGRSGWLAVDDAHQRRRTPPGRGCDRYLAGRPRTSFRRPASP
jgi:hypothetical protein